jgi:catechol 2,3-dioxygenase-like lactoylglutathione lyase family enzyme
MDGDKRGGLEPKTYRGTSPIKVNKLGHLVYEVSDIERSVKFWTEVMGCQVTETNEIGIVFLRYGEDHHGIGLKPGKAQRRGNSAQGLQIEHIAFEVANVDMLLAARDYFRSNDIPIVFEGRKGAGSNYAINFLDPDGHQFEIYCELDQIDASGRIRPRSQWIRAKSLDDAIARPVPKKW